MVEQSEENQEEQSQGMEELQVVGHAVAAQKYAAISQTHSALNFHVNVLQQELLESRMAQDLTAAAAVKAEEDRRRIHDGGHEQISESRKEGAGTLVKAAVDNEEVMCMPSLFRDR